MKMIIANRIINIAPILFPLQSVTGNKSRMMIVREIMLSLLSTNQNTVATKQTSYSVICTTSKIFSHAFSRELHKTASAPLLHTQKCVIHHYHKVKKHNPVSAASHKPHLQR